jgi:hypothetical protein
VRPPPGAAARVIAVACLALLTGCGADLPAAGGDASPFRITSPLDGATVQTLTVVVTGRAPAGTIVVHDISLQADQHVAARPDGSWSIGVALSEGENALTFRMGNDRSTAQTIHVTRESASPDVAVVTPTPASESSPTLMPVPTAVAQTCLPTDQDRFIYNPDRLRVISACLRVEGTVEAIRSEKDGDLHILVALDPAFSRLLTPANDGVELGDLVVEPVCVHAVSQADAVEACSSDPDPLRSLPGLHRHIWLEGRYVLDEDHGGWAELHPLYRWGSLEPAAPVPVPVPVPAPPATSGCDPSYPGICIPPPPPDLNCGDIPYRRFTVLPPDPHHFDGDHDGIGCES